MNRDMLGYIIDFMITLEVVEKENFDFYYFGLEVLFSTVLTGSLLILVAVLLGEVTSVAVFILVFIFLRTWIGGYHASSIAKCTLISIFLFLVSVFLSKLDFWNQSVHLLLIFLNTIALYDFLLRREVVEESGENDHLEKNGISRIIIMSSFLCILSLTEYCNNYCIMAILSYSNVSFLTFISKGKGGRK